MDCLHLAQTLAESFNALADEVQSLTDRKTVLEHKLRFAHEQFQYLADKHAPAAPEISETLAKLQLPPELDDPSVRDATSVPLPKRPRSDAGHKIAVVIRDGRKIARQLTSLGEPLGDLSKTSLSSRESFSRLSNPATSMSTVLEQDFTIEGKKGHLGCPFSVTQDQPDDLGQGDPAILDPTPHQSSDPICAAMFEESMGQPAPASAHGSTGKCPIRFLDQHSPEEIANYVETHKHEIPRSHEVCLRRYQKNEVQIKKLDAKYGNLVSMIQGLSQLHKPMLPSADPEEAAQRWDEVDRASNERVESWAQEVSATAEFPPGTEFTPRVENQSQQDGENPDREGHFDRPFKEVRVGESPSRPWGISVPLYDQYEHVGRPVSPPPAPVLLPSPIHLSPAKESEKCPFDHSKLAGLNGLSSPLAKAEEKGEMGDPATAHHQRRSPSPVLQPAFVNAQELTKRAADTPQMLFTGPVFIGYPVEQAIQLLHHYQAGQR